MKKKFLTIIIVISILLADLAATVLTLGGHIDNTWSDVAVGRLMRAIHDGSLKKSLSGEPDPYTAVPDSYAALPEATESSDTEEPEVLISEAESLAVSTEPKTYDFVTVDDSYFDDALFIGDSRVGLVQFSGCLPGMTYYTQAGYSIYDALNPENAWCPIDSLTIPLAEALAANSNRFKKIYIEFGINGAGFDTVDEFRAACVQMINLIQTYIPDCIIFFCSCVNVTDEFSSQVPAVVTNEQIYDRNVVMWELADSISVFYLDVNSYCCTSTGGLDPEFTTDGYHIESAYSYVWRDCFLAHGIVK